MNCFRSKRHRPSLGAAASLCLTARCSSCAGQLTVPPKGNASFFAHVVPSTGNLVLSPPPLGTPQNFYMVHLRCYPVRPSLYPHPPQTVTLMKAEPRPGSLFIPVASTGSWCTSIQYIRDGWRGRGLRKGWEVGSLPYPANLPFPPLQALWPW